MSMIEMRAILEKGGGDGMKRTCMDFQDPMTIRLPLWAPSSQAVYSVFISRVVPGYVRRFSTGKVD